jgi:type 1 glutamine amidotransferase
MKCLPLLIAALCSSLFTIATVQAADSPAKAKTPVLLIDGQNNHDWKATTPLIKQTLEGSGLFTVEVATAPGKDGDMESFKPEFSKYKVVVSNYNGTDWSEATRKAFEKFVASGGGFVCVHAADNSFPGWDAYNRMIGLGGWGGRSEKDGPYVRWKEEIKSFTRDLGKGSGGQHGKRTPFLMVVRDSDHPITRGLPQSWLQTEDELYGQLRGPAENMHVLATAFSEKETGGTGEHEPILMTIHYGNGRVFHTTLGHDINAMQGTAFQVTLQRGTEWAATGDVTLAPVGADVLSSEKPILRNPAELTSDDGQVPDAEAAPSLETGRWQELFNGKDLAGWTQKNGTAKYRVEEGAIIGATSQGSPNSFLCTDKNYQNFELSFEVMDDPGLNSGVQIRSASKSDYQNGRVHGPQVEIETSPGEAGYIYGEGTARGWISKEQPIKDAYKNDEWNHYLVRAQGERLQVWINGRKVEDLRDAESAQEGFIGLQVHAIGPNEGPFQVRWKNIKLRELK